MEIWVHGVKPTFNFGYKTEANADVRFDLDIEIGIKLAGQKAFIWYDDFRLESVFKMYIIDEVWFSNFSRLEVKQKLKDGEKERSLPLHNGIKMTSEDYQHFMAVVDRKMVDWKSYLNEKVFKSGVPLPFWNLSLKSKLEWHEHAVLVILDFFY